MSKSLQNVIQLNKFIHHPYQLDFHCSLSLFDKLTDFIAKDHKFAIKPLESNQWVNESVKVDLEIKSIDFGNPMNVVSGRIEAKLFLTCQNCLNIFENEIDVPVKIALCADQNAYQGNKDYEPWEIEGCSVKIIDLIEELLLISIPLYVKHHDDKVCVILKKPQTSSDLTTFPFANLKNQLNKDK